MQWTDLKVFLAVARSGTLAGAARALDVNPTTVGRRLLSLEEGIGAQLFARTADGFVPTPAGEAIVEPAERMERQALLIERQIGGEDARLSGDVVVAVSHSFAHSFLIDQLGSFRRAHADIQLVLNTDDAEVDLARGAADVAIRFRRPGTGPGVEGGQVDVIAKRVCSVGIAVYGARMYLDRAGMPPSAYEVAGHDAVMPRVGFDFLPGAVWSAKVADGVRPTIRCDSPQAMAAAVAAGFGLCALPVFLALKYENLVRVSPPATIDSRETWLLMPRDLRRVARVRAVWEFLIETIAAWEPLITG